MNPERWKQLEVLFHSAIEREPEEREAFIADVCGSDSELRQELQSMIAHHEQARTFIEQPAYAGVAEMLVRNNSESLVGKSLGSYQIQSELGKGGMGLVYLAFDTKLRRKVALKFVHTDLTGDKLRVQRFKQEARAASALNHPNILTIFEFGEVDGRQFIATEFVEGETLGEYMRRSPMNLPEVLDVATQIASALSAAHAAGIIHRDIKPENVMVRPDGYIKIVDFGIAKLTERGTVEGEAPTLIQTEAGSRIGTVQYMSPEQIRGLDVDARTDVWSFGVVLYRIIAGRFPFEGETSGDLVASILGSEPDRLSRSVSNLPLEFERIVERALHKIREERYQTVDEMLLDIRQLKSRIEAGEKIATIQNRRKRRLILTTIAAALLVLGTVFVPKLLTMKPRATESGATPSAPAATIERLLNYSLVVQKMRNGKPYDQAFQSNGSEVFQNDWKFRLNFSSPQSGFLYVLSEAPASNHGSGLSILYPDTQGGTGPIRLSGGQTVETGWYVFDRNPGTEKLWMVWSANPVGELEAIRRFFNPNDRGLVSDASLFSSVRQFLITHSSNKTELERATERKQTGLKAKSDPLVHLLELNHR